MSNKTSNSSGDGIGFFGMLCILFIGLKITGYIAWSWWWVVSPLWLPLTVVFSLYIFFAIIKAILD